MPSKKIFPTDQNINFLVCDSARAEEGGKILLLGYLSGEEALVDRLPPVAFPISFVFVFKDGAGTFVGELEIVSPDGTHIPLPAEHAAKEITIVENKPASVIINFPMFLVNSLGSFHVTVKLDGRPYTRKFLVKKN